MTRIDANSPPAARSGSGGARLRALLERGGPILAPGASDGLSARMIEDAGFDAIYLGGGAMARVAGYPDVGVLQLAEFVERVEKVIDVVALPLIVDADTGFGGPANLQRCARLFARLGVAAFHIEDQEFPKRCGLLAGKSIVPIDEMCLKLQLTRQALGSDGPLLIARCDALSVEGFEATAARARAYRAAGADLLFVEGLSNVEQLEAIGRGVDGWKMLDLYPGSESPLPAELACRPDRLADLGFALLVFPSDLQRAAITAMRAVLDALRRDGHTRALADRFVTMAERDRIVRTAEFLSLDRPRPPSNNGSEETR
ncbi:MAG: oxaloacetate decarboxylase [Lautropia sp.]